MFPTCGKYRQNPAANQILPLETLFVPWEFSKRPKSFIILDLVLSFHVRGFFRFFLCFPISLPTFSTFFSSNSRVSTFMKNQDIFHNCRQLWWTPGWLATSGIFSKHSLMYCLLAAENGSWVTTSIDPGRMRLLHMLNQVLSARLIDMRCSVNDSENPFLRMLAALRFVLTKDIKFVVMSIQIIYGHHTAP